MLYITQFKLKIMKFLKPQVQLVRKRMEKNTDEYFLHAVTFCDSTNIRANGHELPLPTLNKDGKYEVNLLAIQDTDLPNHNYLTPIVHSIDLGSLPFGDEDGEILVTLYIEEKGILLRGDNNRPAGQGSVSTASADEEGKPIPA